VFEFDSSSSSSNALNPSLCLLEDVAVVVGAVFKILFGFMIVV